MRKIFVEKKAFLIIHDKKKHFSFPLNEHIYKKCIKMKIYGAYIKSQSSMLHVVVVKIEFREIIAL